MRSVHKPVLLHAVVRNLLEAPVLVIAASTGRTPWYLDGTLGGGGHARALAEALGGRVNLLGLDRDPVAIERAEQELRGLAKLAIFEQADFRTLDRVLAKHGIAEVDLILLDLGISSDELETSGRGFSFQKNEPLQMTMGEPSKHPFTAADIVNGWSEEDIANVIFAYGEERYARRIARAIVNHRLKKPLETTLELAELVKLSVPAFYRRGRVHPATRTFQALRIAVNDELAAVKEGLAKSLQALCPGGRLAVISFHSLEDRLVKEFGRQNEALGTLTIVNKRPLSAEADELAANPRSRSAKLRVFTKN